MKNRFAAIVMAAVACGTAGSVASANFLFSNTRTSFTSGATAYDRVTFFAFNDGTGYSAGGTKLLAMELTAGSTGPIRFANNSFNGDAAGSAAALSTLSANIAAGTPTTTKILRELFTAELFNLFPVNPHLNPDGSFYALGADLTSGNQGIAANVGAGAAFLTVVTQPGATVSLSGGIAGETGSGGGLITMSFDEFAAEALDAGLGLTPFSYVAAVPEPASLLSLGAIAVAGVRRHRRAARA